MRCVIEHVESRSNSKLLFYCLFIHIVSFMLINYPQYHTVIVAIIALFHACLEKFYFINTIEQKCTLKMNV